MRTLVLTAALIAATLSTAAIAADWVFVGKNDRGSTFYIDRGSIRTTPNGYKRAWVRTDFSKPERNGDTGFRSLYEHDCLEGKHRELQADMLKGDTPSDSSYSTRDWVYVRPDTLGETVLNFVCFGKLDE